MEVHTVAKFAFTIAALNKRFAQDPTGIAWDNTRGLGCYRNRDGSLSLFAQYRCDTLAVGVLDCEGRLVGPIERHSFVLRMPE
jgi:hypothetical protein